MVQFLKRLQKHQVLHFDCRCEEHTPVGPPRCLEASSFYCIYHTPVLASPLLEFVIRPWLRSVLRSSYSLNLASSFISFHSYLCRVPEPQSPTTPEEDRPQHLDPLFLILPSLGPPSSYQQQPVLH